MDAVAKLGGAQVTRFEGSLEEAKVYLDELIVESGGDPTLLAFSTMLFDEVEWDTSGGAGKVKFDALSITKYSDIAEDDWDLLQFAVRVNVEGADAEDAARIASQVGSSETLDFTVVGAGEAQAASAVPAYLDYTIRSMPHWDSADAEADFLLIV